jgi:outer membrane protein assembly factor BamB
MFWSPLIHEEAMANNAGGANRRTTAQLFRLVAPIVLVAIVAMPTAARAQVAVMADIEPAEEAPSGAKAFAVLKADSKVIDSIADFKRYSAKKSWELAFRALNSIEESENKGLVPAEDGLMTPISLRIERALLQLPPEGREAYRLFNDASAKKLWDELQDAQGTPASDEIPKLHKLVDNYFLTSVGDLAADRLGDALFEQGNFSKAEKCWRKVVDAYPDTHLSAAKLQVKRCVALAQLGRRDALAALAAQVQQKYADQGVTIGGKEVSAAEFVRSLVLEMPSVHAAPAAKPLDDVALPSSEEPTWQIRTADFNLDGVVDPRFGVPLSSLKLNLAASGAADEKRFYGNLLGTIFAADLQTGKLLWRTGKFSEVRERLSQDLQWGTSPTAFFMVRIGDKLLVGRTGGGGLLEQVIGGSSGNDHTLRMDCLDAATGKTLWSSGNLGVTPLAAPYILNDSVYLIGLGSDATSMVLAAIDTKNGQAKWQVMLGKPQLSRNWRGSFSYGGPTVVALDDTLLVATNNGALLAIDMQTHQIRWAFEHDTKPPIVQQFWGGEMETADGPTSGALLESNGLLYLKDSEARTLYALDPAAPELKWKRPITTRDSVVAIIGPTAYFLGHELSALDLKSRDLKWSTALPGEPLNLRPLISAEHILAPTARGIFDIDPTSGDIRRVFRGADRQSQPRQLLLAGDKLISISDKAVTAYQTARKESDSLSTAKAK